MTDAKKTNTINATLRAARKQRGISIADAAKHVGVTQASFSRMETGEARVTTDRLVTLASYYGYSIAGLLEDAFLVEPSTVDIDRMHAIIVLVQDTIKTLGITPSSEKVADAVTEVYRRDIERAIASGHPVASFDPEAHRGFLERYFKL